MNDFRVLVTGSRAWPSQLAVSNALAEVLRDLQPGGTLTVVHGACRTGADWHAHRWCLHAHRDDVDVQEEQHPADWQRLGRSAGYRRNAEMIALGAQLALAFPHGRSRGTRHCMKLAHTAGIPLRIITHPESDNDA